MSRNEGNEFSQHHIALPVFYITNWSTRSFGRRLLLRLLYFAFPVYLHFLMQPMTELCVWQIYKTD